MMALAVPELIRNNEITHQELLELTIQGVARTNPWINAVVEVNDDAMDVALRAADISGPFSGVPFLRKDLGATEADPGCRDLAVGFSRGMCRIKIPI